MIIDQYQNQLLHPVMQTYLLAVQTLGDGNCLFHSIWKQLFPQLTEDANTAQFMRQSTLYVIYRNENRYRQMVNSLGYKYTFQQYLNDIQQVGRFCGDLALSALSEALGRHIYCYTSFINSETGRFFFDTDDFDTLTALFAARAQGTWQHHNIFSPSTMQANHRQPLKIIFHTNHFTALFTSCNHDDLVPQTNNFNVHQVLAGQ